MLSDLDNQNILGHAPGLHVTSFPYRAESHREGSFQGKRGTDLPRHFFRGVSLHKGLPLFLCPRLTHVLWDVIVLYSRTSAEKVGLCLPPI